MRDNFTNFKSLSGNNTLPVLQLIDGANTNTQTSRWYPSSVTILVSITLVVVALIKLVLLIRERYERHKIFDKGNIPSVGRKNPFSGNLFEVFKPKNITFILRDYHEKLGKNYGVFYGPDPWLVTTDLKLLYKVMVVDANKHPDLNDMRFPYADEFNKSILQAKGSEWRRLRRSLNPPFSHKHMKSDDVTQAIERICEKMLGYIAGCPVETGGGYIVDVQYLFQMFTVETIFRVAYGKENATKMLPGARDEFIEGLHALSQVLMNSIGMFCIMFRTLSKPFVYLTLSFTQVGQMLEVLNSKFDDCLTTRRKRDELKDGHDLTQARPLDRDLLIDTLIELRDSNKMDDVTMNANMIMLFLTGFETTANALTTTLWLLARHQNIQEKLRQAIKIEGEESSYLDWCIKESMRLYPSAPITGRILTEDLTTPEGQTIFKGTTLFANIYSINHSAEYWGQDVEEFRPERFGEPLEHPNQFFSFGSGIRGCLGKNLAMAEMRAVVTRILINFNVKFCDSTPREISWSGRNLLHNLIDGPINLNFVKLT